MFGKVKPEVLSGPVFVEEKKEENELFDVIMHTHMYVYACGLATTAYNSRQSKERDEVKKNKSGRRDGFINFLSGTRHSMCKARPPSLK